MEYVSLKAKGLATHPNPLSLPPGSLLVADNVSIDRDDIIELRRGLKLYGALTSPKKLFNYQNRILAHAGTSMYYDSDNAGTFTALSGTYSAPTGANRIRSMEANKNFYFTTSAGVKKMDSYSATPGMTGMYKALGGTGATTGASGFMANNTQVAYRICWGITDANSNKIIGSPSQRIIVVNNAGATRDVSLTFDIPSGVTTSHIYQVYRSAQSTGVAVEPNDELQLIVEKNPTAGEIVALSVTYTDQTPDNLRGAALYTNPSQEGIAESNDSPPLAKDLAVFKNSAIYANIISKNRMYITLISVGGTGFVIDDTITIAGTVYTGKAGETVASGYFKVTTAGTAAQNIEDTAKSLVKVINQYTSNTLVYAYYISGYQDLPGQILIEERGIGGNTFVAISSRGAAFSPNLPSSGSTYASTSDTQQHAVAISKQDQPEAVPIKNIFPVGSAYYAILRIIPLRDSCFILKEDGIYRITGEDVNNFSIEEFDKTTILKCQESAVSLNNQVFAFTSQGVVSISDGGTRILSRPIELTLLQISTESYTNFDTASFGVAYESDRKYLFATVSATTDTYATQIFCLNFLTNSWTRWEFNTSCGGISKRDNKLYLSDAALNYIRQERKGYTATDYADKEVSLTISAHSGVTVTVSSTTGISAGWTLAQFNGSLISRSSVVASIVDGTHLTTTEEINWNAAAATAYQPIDAEILFAPITGDNPFLLKHFQNQISIFSNANFEEITCTYTTDQSLASQSVDLVPKSGYAWGLGGWGLYAWGGGNPSLQPIPTLIPQEKARANILNMGISHSQALSSFSLAGISVFFEFVSARIK
jgi:hypothetical protein